MGYYYISCEDWHVFKENFIECTDLEGNKGYINKFDIKTSSAYRTDIPDNMGMHLNRDNEYQLTGYVGCAWLERIDGKYEFSIYMEKDSASTIVAISRVAIYVKPRFNIDPFLMIDGIFRDEEYSAYCEKKKEWFKTYTNQPLIFSKKNMGGRLLIAISYVKLCENICRKNLRKQMNFREENLTGKIKGKIDFAKNIRLNELKMRKDRVYCKYSDFSMDTKENRVLKSGLIKAIKIINEHKISLVNIKSSIRYCKNILKMVTLEPLNGNSFLGIKVNGFNACYKAPVMLAKILCDDYSGINLHNNNIKMNNTNETDFFNVIPYCISMQDLFEFYVRFIIKKSLAKLSTDKNIYELEIYDKKFEYIVDRGNDSLHISKHYIPDILIKERKLKTHEDGAVYDPPEYSEENIAVYDVKYKKQGIENTDDTHQIMSYTLLDNVKKCGFVMPSIDVVDREQMEIDRERRLVPYVQIRFEKDIKIQHRKTQDIKYYEFEVGMELDNSNNILQGQDYSAFNWTCPK